MRHTLNAIDPLPEFPSDGLAFELQDSEPAYEPCGRHKRLPSYREVLEAEVARKNSALDIAMARAWRTISDDTKCSLWEIARFNVKCDPHITEADCRKRKDAPAEQPKQSADAPQFKVGDRVRVIADCSFSGLEARVVGIDTLISIEWGVRGARSDGRVRASSLELLPTEPAPQEPQADADGWIPHNPSKPCPVPAGTLVEVRFRNGATYAGRALTSDPCMGASQWTDDGSWLDAKTIVAYRIVA